ncbi:glycine--tRNA ligase subunit beta [Deferribacter autotrophicus]|uniref:Glycine--tRNA ligase beta subunit n=1 Tax=Deferribacter autotrophicus TaxID=500465 RepID=A0A5A8F586_9BACT|nr:glycine--tRNA ligase subunit beta [Deferribacter autotrophicus]KAA0258544.1 glycine--tRNA ligase subunit beta [Deferribacter autotrophicus]
MSFYMLEIGTEEIPASFINPAADYLKNKTSEELEKNRIKFNSIISGGTPRRLYLYIDGIEDKQADLKEEIVGPPANIAFDENGNLTKAGIGFAKSRGLDIASLKKVTTEKGEYLAGIKQVAGEETTKILPDLIVKIIRNIPFPKSMKWGTKKFRFARPVHWFLSIYNGDILPFEIDGIKASNYTYGHRFMAREKIIISNFDDYKTKLNNAFVIIDFEERKKIINDALNSFGNVVIDEELLNTVTNLVEYPHPVMGHFPEDFLKLPKEVLVTSMKSHQKYFYVVDDNGKITNKFVGISNTKPKDDSLIRTGYERVLKARLNDAMFFFENDKKIPLSERVEQLKSVIYQEKLGTSYEKMQRFRKIANYLAMALNPSAKETTDRAAYLCKGDLMTEMVYEFPELQGIMGREYALIQGENEIVAKAIYEHYLPRFAGDDLPETDEGSFVSIADKIDTIVGCFIIGLIPSGNNDPYALRRNAIGIINIILNKNYKLDLNDLINVAMENYKEKLKFDQDEILKLVREFILTRSKQIAHSQYGVRSDIFDAVTNNFSDIVVMFNAAKALNEVREKDDFIILSTSYKRISNILKKNNWEITDYNPELFKEEAEKELHSLMINKGKEIEDYINKEDFDKAINVLLEFREPVDKFFDNVLVMDKDENIKNNRLSLLASLRNIFNKVGDLSYIN